MLGRRCFATGKVGQAFLFNGSPNSFITLPNSSNILPASNQLTIDAWVKPNFSINNQWDNILAKRDGCGASGNSYNFGINKGDPSDPFGAIAFAMSSSDGGITRATSGSTTVPNDGQFHHVAATYDGSVMQVYLDGQLVGQAARSGLILTTTSAAVISHHGGSCVQRAVAAIDEIEFYDRALSAWEIQAIFDAGSAGKCQECLSPPSGMTGWWPGDGNTDDIVGGRDAALQSNATTVPSLVGQGFLLDGDADFVVVPHYPVAKPVYIDFTIDLCVFFNDTAVEQVFVEKCIQLFHPHQERMDVDQARWLPLDLLP